MAYKKGSQDEDYIWKKIKTVILLSTYIRSAFLLKYFKIIEF